MMVMWGKTVARLVAVRRMCARPSERGSIV